MWLIPLHTILLLFEWIIMQWNIYLVQLIYYLRVIVIQSKLLCNGTGVRSLTEFYKFVTATVYSTA